MDKIVKDKKTSSLSDKRPPQMNLQDPTSDENLSSALATTDKEGRATAGAGTEQSALSRAGTAVFPSSKHKEIEMKHIPQKSKFAKSKSTTSSLLESVALDFSVEDIESDNFYQQAMRSERNSILENKV